jgi:hypothetical protein
MLTQFGLYGKVYRMTDEEIRAMAEEILHTTSVVGLALQAIGVVMVQAETGSVVWKEEPFPNPEAARVFSGVTPTHTLMVSQANVKDRGIIFNGVLTCQTAPHIVPLPPEIAEKLYRAASTSRN